jgi:hypothetical protein
MSLVIGLALVAACARPQPPESGPKSGPKVEYKDLKPEVYPVPEEVKQALPGLQNDNIYIYREVSPTINLVANLPQYSLPEAIRRTAQALVALTRDPRFRAGIDFWIIQTQPEPDKGPEVLVWGVRPAEALADAQQGDLTRFFTDSEYVLVNDKIIPAGPERAAFLK